MVIYVYSGLTSRLYTICDAVELCRRYKEKQLIVLWPIVSDCQIAPDEVLKLVDNTDLDVMYVGFKSKRKQYKEINIKKSIFQSVLACLYNIYVICYNKVFDKESHLLKKYVGNKDKYDYNPPKEVGWSGEAYHQYNKKVWMQIKNRVQLGTDIYIHAYCGIIKEFEKRDLSVVEFRQEYWNIVNKIIGKYSEGGQLVGVHIRRTDHNVCIMKSPTWLFIEKIESLLQEDAERLFFLATDDLEVENELKNRFPHKIVVQKKAVWGRDSIEGMKSGIVDMLCLSQCEFILGSCTSVFSRFAAEYGGIELIEVKETEK